MPQRSPGARNETPLVVLVNQVGHASDNGRYLVRVAIVEVERVRAGQKLHILSEAAPAARVVLHGRPAVRVNLTGLVAGDGALCQY